MSTQVTQATQPLAELGVNDCNMAAADDDEEEEVESKWRRLCDEARCPEAYIPKGAPGYTDELQTHKAKQKKAKAATTKRHGTMRKRIAAAQRTLAATDATATPADADLQLGAQEKSAPPSDLAAPSPIADVEMSGGCGAAAPVAAPPAAAPPASAASVASRPSIADADAGPVAPAANAAALGAPAPVDTGAWCRIDPAEVAAARTALQEGVFERSLAAKAPAPKLPKFPRRPEPVVDLTEHARRQLVHERAHADVARLRGEHAAQMAERATQRAAELHRLRQECQAEASRRFYNLDWRLAELDAVIPGKYGAMFPLQQPDELKRLHLQYCCPPIDSPAWRDRSISWRLPLAWQHDHCGSGHHSATAACDRRRKLLGVERLAPHAAAEAAYGGRFTLRAGHSEPAAWRDWLLLHIHWRVHGITSPPLTCTRDRCGCTAVTQAQPLKLPFSFPIDRTLWESTPSAHRVQFLPAQSLT